MSWQTILDIAAIGGFFLTAIGTFVTIHQANKAKKSATKVEIIKNEIIKIKNITELSELLQNAKDIESILISRTSKNSAQSSGRNTTKEYEKIQSFLSSLNQAVAKIQEPLKTELQMRYNSLVLSVPDYITANNDISKIAHIILSDIRTIISKITEQVNKKTFYA